MKILLVGASGMVGSRIAAEAVSRGHTVIAASRNPEKIAAGAGITPVQLDASDAAALTALAKDADIIVSSTSSKMHPDRTERAVAIAQALIAAAKATGKRLAVVGGAGSLKRPDGSYVIDSVPDQFKAEPVAMKAVLDTVKASDVDWTFLSPARNINPGERTGKFRLGGTDLLLDADGESKISAEDYSIALVDELENPKHSRKQFSVAY